MPNEVIQIGTVESIVGLLVIVFGIGASWASLKKSVEGIERTISEDIKPELKAIRDHSYVLEARVGGLEHSAEHLNVGISDLRAVINNEMRPEVKEIRDRLSVVETKIEAVLWEDLAPVGSPRQLNERGTKILTETGMKEIIDAKRTELTTTLKALNPTNPYDAEGMVEDVVKKLPEQYPEILDGLKDGAFRTGATLDAALYVGSIYFRNLVFPELGFKIEEPDSEKS